MKCPKCQNDSVYYEPCAGRVTFNFSGGCRSFSAYICDCGFSVSNYQGEDWEKALAKYKMDLSVKDKNETIR